jgi:hypothetical protein
MDGLKLTDMQWKSIEAAWDQEPSRRPVLSSEGEPMIYSWRPETEAAYIASPQLDLNAEEAITALGCLSRLMRWTQPSDAIYQGVKKVFSFIVCLGCIPIRLHEDTLLQSIYDCVPVNHESGDWDSPYFKIFLLLHAHFTRLRLSQELAADQAIVLERVFSLFSMCAHHNSVYDGFLGNRSFDIFRLMHMCVQGLRWYDEPLRQIPHSEADVSQTISREDFRLVLYSR